MHRPAALILCLLLVSVAPALAQQPAATPAPVPREPIAAFVADARVAWPSLKEDADVATSLGVETDDLPDRGPGFILGAQVYVARRRAVKVGIGGEMLWARAGHTVPPLEEGDPDGPRLENRWSHLSPQVSLNFGSKDGWSYLTGGIGWSKLTMERQDEPQESGSRILTLNYGGGARWFMKKHLALNMDLRFYSVGSSAGGVRRPYRDTRDAPLRLSGGSP